MQHAEGAAAMFGDDLVPRSRKRPQTRQPGGRPSSQGMYLAAVHAKPAALVRVAERKYVDFSSATQLANHVHQNRYAPVVSISAEPRNDQSDLHGDMQGNR